MNPGFFRHLILICQFELKRLFTTRKGLLYLITFAVIWYFILLYPIRFASDFLGQQQNTPDSSSFFQFIGFGSLLDWKIPELGVYWHFSLILFPLLTVMSSADQTCSDRERGTLRFLCLRVSRDSVFFGRFSGFMLIQAILICTSLLSTVALITFRDATMLPVAFNNAMAIFINLLIALLPFTAMMALLSAIVQSARQATVWAILIWSFLAGIITILSSYLPALNNLKFLIPGYQMSALSQLTEWQALQLAYIPLLQTIALLILGHWVMQRQSL